MTMTNKQFKKLLFQAIKERKNSERRIIHENLRKEGYAPLDEDRDDLDSCLKNLLDNTRSIYYKTWTGLEEGEFHPGVVMRIDDEELSEDQSLEVYIQILKELSDSPEYGKDAEHVEEDDRYDFDNYGPTPESTSDKDKALFYLSYGARDEVFRDYGAMNNVQVQEMANEGEESLDEDVYEDAFNADLAAGGESISGAPPIPQGDDQA